MEMLSDLLYALEDFFEQGGPVLWVLFVACLLLWLMILERLWFLRIVWPRRARKVIAGWQARQDRSSWLAKKRREATVSEASLQLHLFLPLIRVLVSLCPLLGLLGTALGMIEVFEVIAISGNDDAQAMARGVYRATIPTMAGLVVALTGIYFIGRLRQLADRETGQLADRMVTAEGAPGGVRERHR